MLADFPRLGSVCRIHTCSYRSIRQIHSALQEIQTFTGGRLAGITAKLTVRPEEATYFDRKEKRKKTSSIWALGLEVEGDDMQKLIANLTENARLFAETRKLLGSGGKVFEVVEDEQEQAPEVAAEFYPASVNGSPIGEGPAAGSSSDAIPPLPPASDTTFPGETAAPGEERWKPLDGPHRREWISLQAHAANGGMRRRPPCPPHRTTW